MLLFLHFHAVTFIITDIRVSIKNNPAVMVSFIAKFANIVIVSNVIIIRYTVVVLSPELSNKPFKMDLLTMYAGKKAFSSAAPRLWNNLLLAMRATDSFSSFKKKLKTFLFKRVFFY